MTYRVSSLTLKYSLLSVVYVSLMMILLLILPLIRDTYENIVISGNKSIKAVFTIVKTAFLTDCLLFRLIFNGKLVLNVPIYSLLNNLLTLSN